MDAAEFRKRGHELIDFIADYLENTAKKFPTPKSSVKPNTIVDALPKNAPEAPEPWENIQKDIDNLIVPNITHWQHPRFFAFFPANNSYPGILGDLLSAGLGVQGMIWATSPACTELETVVMDWLGKMMNLPDAFLSSESKGKGGGVIQGTASETTLVNLIAARHRTLEANKDKATHSNVIVYTSDQAHSSVKKACMVAGVHLDNLRVLETNELGQLMPETLEKAILDDKSKGLFPCYTVATVGTTGVTANDPIRGLGEITQKHNVWFHVDAAFSGAACILPDFRCLLDGIELADSFNFNPHKWLLVNFDCSAHWVKDRNALIDSLSVTPSYLRNAATDSGAVIDYRDWQIPLGRRFRALKLWFVLRTYGVKGLQDFVKKHIDWAQKVEEWVKNDDRFEIVVPRTTAMVVFKIKGGDDDLQKALVEHVNNSGFYIIGTKFKGNWVVRFMIGTRSTTYEDVEALWDCIQKGTEKLLTK